MPFTQSTVSYVNPPVYFGSQMRLSWVPTTAGLTWQVYVNNSLAWHGTSTVCYLPKPAADVQIDIGSVGPDEATTNYNSSLGFGVGGFGSSGFGLVPMLPPKTARRAQLTWSGGTFQSTKISGFRVYGEDTPGGGIDYSKVLADIPAYVGGIISDGFGLGGFGSGGFGQSESNYTWTSDPLATGTWSFAVKTYNKSGNFGSATTFSVTIAAPPQPPSPFADGSRLQYSLSGFGFGGFGDGLNFGNGGFGNGSFGGGIGFGLAAATLNWNASPTTS